ncbi:copper chaperone PCu(A)C [hot springs metagenome]|uniref:Copper chaperone PCu(A)C n=1 Tax=hot springs metagenome TaxID=433727 RepID=A0A5J4L3H9_9ZZZZ
MRLRILLIIMAVTIANCVQKPPDIQISDAVTVASPIMHGVVSVFMRISNNGGRDMLVGASTDIDGSVVELHDVKDGKMVKVKGIKIPSHDKIEMIPGGMHIMIFKMPDEIKDGFEFTLYLHFERYGKKAVKLKVVKG